jgi:oligopeptidase A
MQFARSSALRERLYRALRDPRQRPGRRGCASSTTPASSGRSWLAAGRSQTARLQQLWRRCQWCPKWRLTRAGDLVSCATWLPRPGPSPKKTWPTCAPLRAEHLGLADPQPWDWPYVGEKLKEARYAFSEQEVKQYFTAPKVLGGLFKIAETLFEVRIRRDRLRSGTRAWSSTASSADRTTRQRGGGPYSGGPVLPGPGRPHRQTRRRLDGRCARPLAAPRQQPAADPGGAPGLQLCPVHGGGWSKKPPLLTHDDVTTLFHEFGHGLHHMLTQVNERDVSGISGVEWDAVELPSQFMENFCWEWDVLKHMTAHVDTGAPLPRALFDKMLAARISRAACRRCARLSSRCSTCCCTPSHAGAWRTSCPCWRQVREEVAVVQAPRPGAARPIRSAIFLPAAMRPGYYSYKWAEVLSADAYAAFEETAGPDGLPNLETGRKYREAILEAGGSRPAMESFKAFPGASRLWMPCCGTRVWQQVSQNSVQARVDTMKPSLARPFVETGLVTRLGLGAMIALCLSAGQAQTIYRIVGPDGKISFSDKPPAAKDDASATDRQGKDAAAERGAVRHCRTNCARWLPAIQSRSTPPTIAALAVQDVLCSPAVVFRLTNAR